MTKLVEIEVCVIDDSREKSVAVLFGDKIDADPAKCKWTFLPRSQIELHPTDTNPKHRIVVMPEWLATEKGLI